LFEGIEEFQLKQPRELSGPSAGQSSLIYALDIFLGMDVHQRQADHANSFLERMKLYMPRHHRAFLAHLAREPQKIRQLVIGSNDEKLKEAFNLAVTRLKLFRDEHIRIVALYIITQGHTPDGPRHKGTGGTDAMPFLKAVRDRTFHSLVER